MYGKEKTTRLFVKFTFIYLLIYSFIVDVQFFIFYFSCLRAIGFLFFECVKRIFLEKNLSIIFLFSWSFRENSTYLVFVYSLIFFLFFLSRFYPCLSSCISCRLFLIGHVYLVYISVLLYLCLLATVCLLLLPCLPKKNVFNLCIFTSIVPNNT